MDIIAPLLTGYGIWAPVAWMAAFVVVVIIVYLLWKTGESSYKKGTELERPYLSGNAEPEKGLSMSGQATCTGDFCRH